MKNVALMGPTATGKTSLALELCKLFDGEVVSVDSRQVYNFMDLGTGKIPLAKKYQIEKHAGFWELDGVRVWAYDVVNPDSYFAAYDYFAFIQKIKFTKRVVFWVGGTGFYFDLLLGLKKVSGTPPDFDLRKNFEGCSKEELYQVLTKLNPKKAQIVDRKNKLRLVRAIEVERYLQKNRQPQDRSLELISDPLLLGFHADRNTLFGKADEWVDEIFDRGILNEVRGLIAKGYENAKPVNGIIYKTVKQVLANKIDRKTAIEKIKFELHAYIRRQETYFKKIRGVEWLDVSKSGFDIKVRRLVQSKLNE
ncbi:hypothetical protein HY419_01025 [candidate division WWE3 bacterium]|nr:hypothetical protein [candidate division WWE3 bacterium]